MRDNFDPEKLIDLMKRNGEWSDEDADEEPGFDPEDGLGIRSGPP